jgi:hypothetical protein
MKVWTPVPWNDIADLWNDGYSITRIAKAVDRYHEQATDPTKSMRVLISMMVTKGYADRNGALVFLKKRNPSNTGRKVNKTKRVKR